MEGTKATDPPSPPPLLILRMLDLWWVWHRELVVRHQLVRQGVCSGRGVAPGFEPVAMSIVVARPNHYTTGPLHPDMCIYILLFPTLNFSVLITMPRIESAIKILFQICYLMKQHLLVSTLSAAWKCRCYPFCSQEHTIQRTWKWILAWIETKGIFGFYYYLQLADTLKYILNDIFIWIIKEQCSDKEGRRWNC